MRRGLLAWSKDEVPAAVLDARIGRVQAALAGAEMDALLLYTNFPRPAAVSWLTHFVPYWSQGVLVVLLEGPPTLFVSLSKRVSGWIERTSHIAEVVCTPNLGATVMSFLTEHSATSRAIGVLELSRLPGGIAGELVGALGPDRLVDGTALFRSVRHPADETEIALSVHAMQMAGEAFAALELCASSAPLVAALDGGLRARGAEEVLIAVAPDLAREQRLLRPEADLTFARRAAVQLSLAYKGHWIRMTRTLVEGRVEVEPFASFSGALTAGAPGSALAATLAFAVPGARLETWYAESNHGSSPLSQVASDRSGSAPPLGSVASITARYRSENGPVVLGAPSIL